MTLQPSHDPFADPLHPIYHFAPPANWLNDPNGLIHWQGKYHLFYQHNPAEAVWGPMHWGHAVSPDLVHWQHLPIALSPTPDGPDKDGAWSGCAVDDGGTPTLVYTGVFPESVNLATSADPDLRTWTKFEGNPVIARPPEGLTLSGFRDPCVWREGGEWRMVIGAGERDNPEANTPGKGMVLLYRSPDLRTWEYLHPLCERVFNPAETLPTGMMWECPSFFPLDGKWVLLVAAHLNLPVSLTVGFLGEYRDGKFTPGAPFKVDYGDRLFYAPQTFLDASGRRLMFGWLYEGRTVRAHRAAGWAGVMSLPRLLSLRPDGRMGCEPAPETAALRSRLLLELQDTDLGEENLLEGIAGTALEIELEVEPGSAAALHLQICTASDGSEQTRLAYHFTESRLVIDTTHASLDPEAAGALKEAPLGKPAGEPLHLRAFLDRSVLEVFADGWACLTTRLYPTKPTSTGLNLFARGGKAKVHSLKVWEMGSAFNPEA